MIITVKRGKSDKVHIYVDGAYVITVALEKWLTCGYHDGDEISEESWNELYAKFYFDRIYSASLDLLSYREHSRRELVDKLYRKFVIKPFSSEFACEFSEKSVNPTIDRCMISDQIDLVCEKLILQGLLDDERYARLYAEELIRTKNMGLDGIRMALAKRGISRAVIDEVCDSLEFDANESIKTILATRYRNYDLYDESHMSKIMSSLQRKGYRLSEIRKAYYEYLEDYVSPV